MELHVALNGKSENSGISPEIALPDIQKAYDTLVRAYRSGSVSGTSRIFVHSGVYELSAPLHFYASCPVEILPWQEDEVVISGGVHLTQWKPGKWNGKKIFRHALPPTCTELPFFYVNGRRARPACFPKKGMFRVADDGRERTGTYVTPEERQWFPVSKEDFRADWYDLPRISIRMFHWWTEETLSVASYDEEKGVVTTSNCRIFQAKPENTEYICDNVREALSEPGEYYFDFLNHELWYLPRHGETMKEAILPCRGVLARFDQGVSGVTLKKLHFRYGGAYIPQAGATYDLRDPRFPAVTNHANLDFFSLIDPRCRYQQSAQGAVQLPGMLFFADAKDCCVEECEISLCAWYAVTVAEAGRNLFFRNNHLHHLGGGGFALCGGNYESCRKDPGKATSHITVTGNHIHDCGEHFASALGIVMTQTNSCLIAGNHIHDLYYSGISCGWTWGFQPTMSRENRIENNHIHDLGKGLLSDMGGIYTLGVQPGTRVSGNHVHGIKNRYYGGWGLYADEGSAHIIFENNLVYDCACDGFHQHYGRENVLRNNIFALNEICAAGVGRAADDGYFAPGRNASKAVLMVNNLFLCKGELVFKFVFEHLLAQEMIFSDNNIFWNLDGGRDLHFQSGEKTLSFAQWQKAGMDRHSVVADPKFRNLEKRDFRTKLSSILEEYGIQIQNLCK